MQLQLVTAAVKLFLKNPQPRAQQMIQLVLTYATQVRPMQCLAAPPNAVHFHSSSLSPTHAYCHSGITMIPRASVAGLRVRAWQVEVCSHASM